MASTTTLKYGPKISLSHGTTKGGGPDPFVVKDYENGPFFIDPFPKFEELDVLGKLDEFVELGELNELDEICVYVELDKLYKLDELVDWKICMHWIN